MNNCIGIDVSKASINVHISKNSQDLEFVNSIKGFKSLYSKLKKIYQKEIKDIVFIFEPTGSYSEALRKYCSQQKIKCFIINPKQFSNYAKALGAEIKNDIEDARVHEPTTLGHPADVCSDTQPELFRTPSRCTVGQLIKILNM